MIIAFDLTKRETFEGVKTWINSIYKHSDPTIAKVLVGNKVDLEDERCVSKSEAQKVAEEHGMEYFETSARSNINVQEVMSHIIEKVYESMVANNGFGSSLGEEADGGKESLVLKRTTTSNNASNNNNAN